MKLVKSMSGSLPTHVAAPPRPVPSRAALSPNDLQGEAPLITKQPYSYRWQWRYLTDSPWASVSEICPCLRSQFLPIKYGYFTFQKPPVILSSLCTYVAIFFYISDDRLSESTYYIVLFCINLFLYISCGDFKDISNLFPEIGAKIHCIILRKW